MKKTSEVLSHPLWMLPVMLLAILALIEGLHTGAHLRMKIDTHGYCMRNEEFINSQNSDDDW